MCKVISGIVLLVFAASCGSRKGSVTSPHQQCSGDLSCPDPAFDAMIHALGPSPFGLVGLPYRPLCHHVFQLMPGQQFRLEVVLNHPGPERTIERIDKQAFLDAGFIAEAGVVFEQSTTKQVVRFRRHDIIGDLSRDKNTITLRLQRTAPDGQPLPWLYQDELIGQVRPSKSVQCPTASMRSGSCVCNYAWLGAPFPKHCEFRLFTDDARFPPERQLPPIEGPIDEVYEGGVRDP